jgi:hypothetical protein
MIALISKKASVAAIAALACASAVALPGVASAQSYGYDYPPAYGYGNSGYGQGTYYDPCVRDQRQRATTGGLLGAAIGAVAGSQMAARGRRTEGSALGGVRDRRRRGKQLGRLRQPLSPRRQLWLSGNLRPACLWLRQPRL